MKIHFFKYHGTGNDFIIVDNRLAQQNFSKEQIQKLCHRKFGIGADGFITLTSSKVADFEMKFWNNDGSNSMMCGNGGRCIAAFAHHLGIFEKRSRFIAPDGIHVAEILNENETSNTVSLSMCDTKLPQPFSENEFYINTGSPHLVVFVKDIKNTDVFSVGSTLRNDPRFAPDGVNVDFVEIICENQIFVRTFERGVENETLSCGTGVTASAIAYAFKNKLTAYHKISVQTLGGTLEMLLEKDDIQISNIRLVGAATLVFQGFYND